MKKKNYLFLFFLITRMSIWASPAICGVKEVIKDEKGYVKEILCSINQSTATILISGKLLHITENENRSFLGLHWTVTNDYFIVGKGIVTGKCVIQEGDSAHIVESNETFYIDSETPKEKIEIGISMKSIPMGYPGERIDLYFIYDITVDKPTVIPNSEEWFSEPKTLIASGADIVSGVDYYEYSFDGISWRLGDRVTVSEGIKTVYFRMIDKLGNISESTRVIANVDLFGPNISYYFNNGGDQGFVKQECITINVSDTLSGVKKTEYKIDNGNWITLNTSSIEITENGIHEIIISSRDNVDNESIQIISDIKIDNQLPQYEAGEEIPILELNDKKIENLIVPIEISDNLSGVKSFQIMAEINQNSSVTLYSENNWKNFCSNFTEGHGKQVICNLSERIDRTQGNTISIFITATDVAGNNGVIKTYPKIFIPAWISPEFETSIISDGKIVTKLKVFPKLEEEIKQDVNLSYLGNRIVYERNPGENDESELIEVFNAEKFFPEIKDTILIDSINITSGLGHKFAKYKILQSFMYWDKTYTEELPSLIVYLANNEPEVSLIIQGKEESGEDKNFFIDMSNPSNNISDIRISESGIVRMGVRIKDYDIENYHVELSQVKDLKFSNGNTEKIVIPVKDMVLDGRTEKSLTDEMRVFKQKLHFDEFEYELFNNSVLLNFNDQTKYVLTYREGDDLEKDTKEVILEATYVDNGLILKVGNGEYKENGITAQVNSKIEFKIRDKDNSFPEFEWNFGDGTELKKASEICHIYGQSPERQGAESSYLLTVKNGEENEAIIPIHIMDTQYGEMLGNEVWVGEHFVLGEIVIPSNTSLQLGISEKPDPFVYVYGAKDKQKKGKFTVQSGGMIIAESDKKTFFSEAKNSENGFVENKTESEHFGWDGIRAESGSKILLKNTEIRYAERALILCGPSQEYEFENLFLHDNKVGIHILDAQIKKILNCEIKQNKKYGIKEDGENCSIEIFEGNDFSENGSLDCPRNYYRTKETLVEVNK